MESTVDDELDITCFCMTLLQAIEGVSIFTFTDPNLTLKHFTINKAAYAMVISDLRMASLNGMELIKNIKEMNPFIRTVLRTAFAFKDGLFQENGSDF